MNIYLIKQKEDNSYDTTKGVVIVANTTKECRELAKTCRGDQLNTVWNKATVKKLGNYTGKLKKPFIVLIDFKAG